VSGTLINIFKNLKKKLHKKKIVSTGHNHHGRYTIWHRGGGHKLNYRLLDFKYALVNLAYIVLDLEKDPNRSGIIALVLYSNNIVSYILAPQNIQIGFYSVIGTSVPEQYGAAMPLRNISDGTLIFNLELYPGKGGQLARAAGTFVLLIGKSNIRGNKILVRLKSGEEYLLNCNCFTVIGKVSNEEHNLMKLYKAGQARWMNYRPHVRGVAMNPIDHPHGGGEGKTSGGRCSVSPYGLLTKGKKTRHLKINPRLIVKRKFKSK
jgi:large subunit ribosomal protein L2